MLSAEFKEISFFEDFEGFSLHFYGYFQSNKIK